MNTLLAKSKLICVWLGMLLLASSIQPVRAQEEPKNSYSYQVFLPAIQKDGDLNQEGNAEQEWSTIDMSAPLSDGQISFGANTVIATITLDNQSVLRFVKFGSGDIALLEETPEGAMSTGEIAELAQDASLADVFYALSKPGTVTPPELLAVSSPTATAKPQGWVRSFMTASVIAAQLTTGNCNDTNFQNWFAQFAYNDRGTPDFRLNQAPGTSSYFALDHYAPGNGYTYNFYDYVVGGNQGSIWDDVDRYASRVAVCNIDVVEPSNPYGLAHPSISYQGYSNSHMGPVVRMMYRRPGETTWSTATFKDFASSEVGKVLSWHFNTGSNWDWRTDIYWAGADDSFDIGHALEDL